MPATFPCQAYAGTILPWGTTQIPVGWLLCNGQSFDPSTYPHLYQVLGSHFGSSNVPNLNNRFPMGSNNEDDFPLGKTKGTSQIVFTDAQFPAHAHAVVQTVTLPQATMNLVASIPYNASDTNTTAVPSNGSVLGTAWVSRKGAKTAAYIYSTQKQSVSNMQLSVTSPTINISATTPAMTVGVPIAPWGEGELVEGPQPVSPPCIPYYQSVVFIICANGGLPPHPINL